MPKKYEPPPLPLTVWLRNPADRPRTEGSRYGRRAEPTLEDGWGIMVRAMRRDRQTQTRHENGSTIYVQHSVWTIRHRTGVQAEVELVHDNKVYRSIGPPVLRGHYAFGRRTRYLEIYTELRQ